ncbi:hypothetical protein BCR44DRAFT_132455 [Catenaria anguillulae PL171]|uniref:Regulator of chromosome condensation 1/beta-lactamase-inhibitor protein II n=1 Tax=Catenaria anguillulae PL171 TaxID=765915 RepID=A0A1Y2HUH2_9FUNG|nr:hypothetical protein BCR44DRAFT_132455 [Catenaria anguillulae PL171]
MPGALKQVQLDGNVVCGVNVADQIYCADQNIFFNLVWDPLPGRLMHVSVSNGRLYGVSRDGKIWYGESYKVPNWRQVPGEGRMVDLDVNVACHVALRSNNVFCAELGNDFANPQWFQVRGPQLKSVSVSIGRLYGITTRNQIVYTESLRNPRWTLVPGSLTQVELRGRIVCGVNDRDEIFCASGDVANPQWKQLNGALRHVSVSNGALYGVNRADMIYSAV